MEGSRENTEPPGGTGKGMTPGHRWALAIGFAVVALGILALLIAIYVQLAYPLLWAATLTVLVYPVHQRILRLLGGRSRLAASATTLLALAIVFIPAGFAFAHFIGEARNLWPSVRDSLGPANLEKAARWVEQSRFRALAHFLVGESPGTGAEGLQTRFQDLAISLQDTLLDRLRSVSRSIPAMVVQIAVTLLSFFFFLKDGAGWVERIGDALPLDPRHVRRLVGITGQTINAVFRGVILTALIQAILAGLGYFVAGAPAPLVLSLFTFVTALIPFVGPVAIWLPTAIGLYAAGRIGPAIGLAIWGTGVVSIIDNTFRPYVIGRGTKLPLLWLLLAIVGGLKLFGFLGVVLGPAVLALAMACARIYQESRTL